MRAKEKKKKKGDEREREKTRLFLKIKNLLLPFSLSPHPSPFLPTGLRPPLRVGLAEAHRPQPLGAGAGRLGPLRRHQIRARDRRRGGDSARREGDGGDRVFYLDRRGEEARGRLRRLLCGLRA